MLSQNGAIGLCCYPTEEVWTGRLKHFIFPFWNLNHACIIQSRNVWVTKATSNTLPPNHPEVIQIRGILQLKSSIYEVKISAIQETRNNISMTGTTMLIIKVVQYQIQHVMEFKSQKTSIHVKHHRNRNSSIKHIFLLCLLWYYFQLHKQTNLNSIEKVFCKATYSGIEEK